MHNSSENVVVLSSVQLSSSGVYRCEVSGEAPSFETVTEHREMMVVGKLTTSFIVIETRFFFEFLFEIENK